jgi:hypothetical protein
MYGSFVRDMLLLAPINEWNDKIKNLHKIQDILEW